MAENIQMTRAEALRILWAEVAFFRSDIDISEREKQESLQKIVDLCRQLNISVDEKNPDLEKLNSDIIQLFEQDPNGLRSVVPTQIIDQARAMEAAQLENIKRLSASGGGDKTNRARLRFLLLNNLSSKFKGTNLPPYDIEFLTELILYNYRNKYDVLSGSLDKIVNQTLVAYIQAAPQITSTQGRIVFTSPPPPPITKAPSAEPTPAIGRGRQREISKSPFARLAEVNKTILTGDPQRIAQAIEELPVSLQAMVLRNAAVRSADKKTGPAQAIISRLKGLGMFLPASVFKLIIKVSPESFLEQHSALAFAAHGLTQEAIQDAYLKEEQTNPNSPLSRTLRRVIENYQGDDFYRRLTNFMDGSNQGRFLGREIRLPSLPFNPIQKFKTAAGKWFKNSKLGSRTGQIASKAIPVIKRFMPAASGISLTLRKLVKPALAVLGALFMLALHYGAAALAGFIGGLAVGLPFSIPAALSVGGAVATIPVIGWILAIPAGFLTFIVIELGFGLAGLGVGIWVQANIIDKIAAGSATVQPAQAAATAFNTAGSAAVAAAPAVGVFGAVGGTMAMTLLATFTIYSVFLPPPEDEIAPPEAQYIRVIKTAQPMIPVVGGTVVNYKIEVTSGVDKLTKIKIEDVIDIENLEKIQVPPPGVIQGNIITWPEFEIEGKGTTATFTYQATAKSIVTDKTKVTNIVTVSGVIPTGETITRKSSVTLNSDGSEIAAKAKDIIDHLHPGFWENWNWSQCEDETDTSCYPELFDMDEHTLCSNHCVYRDGYPEGCCGNYQDIGASSMFWCTWLVVKSYNETGHYIPVLIGANAQADWFKGQGKFLGPDTDYTQIQPGDAIFFEVPAVEMGKAHHVGIVAEVNSDFVRTYESNSSKTSFSYTVGADGTVQDTSYLNIFGFGRP